MAEYAAYCAQCGSPALSQGKCPNWACPRSGEAKEEAKFPCTQCGACCLDVSNIPYFIANGMVDDDKSCSRLSKNFNTGEYFCSIYERRPLICQVDANCPPGVSMPDWHLANLKACTLLAFARTPHRAMELIQLVVDRSAVE